MKPYPIHPMADKLPEMSDSEFEALRENIDRQGQEVAILVYKDQVIDGRHRQRACCELGIEPLYEIIEDPMTITEIGNLIWSLNFERREHTTALKISMAKALLDYTPVVGRHAPSKISAKVVAATTNTSRKTVIRHNVVQDLGTADLKHAVDSGMISLGDGSAISRMDPEKQDFIVSERREIEAHDYDTAKAKHQALKGWRDTFRTNPEPPQFQLQPILNRIDELIAKVPSSHRKALNEHLMMRASAAPATV